MKRAMIVGHPDDEILWGGGLPIRYPGDWTVICCSVPNVDLIRAYQFFAVCEALGCKARLIPCREKEALENLGWMDLTEFGHIVTHGEKGEYGHLHHMQVHRHVRQNAGSAHLTFFGYGLGRHIIDLTAEETDKKFAAFRKYSYRRFHKGREMTQCEALIDIHYTGNIPMNRETYDGDWPFP